jgi:hypothetical protein
MQRTADRLLFAVILLFIFAGSAYALRYMYLTDCDQTRLGEWVRFWHGDTLEGPVHSNTQIGIMQDPQFYDEVSQAGAWTDFEHGTAYNPGFHGPAPIFQAPHANLPTSAASLRYGASLQGNFYDAAGKSYRLHFRGDSADVYQWWTGTLFDSSDHFAVATFPEHCFFFDDPLEVYGRLHGSLSVGCSHTILIIDNVLYVDADSLTGCTPPGSENFLMLASEKEIKIANTYANGRNNSNGRGNAQTNRDSTSVVISAALYALGESFTFEQQNDPDSGYVYQEPVGAPHVDDRGTLYVFGSLVEHRRGYFHRASNGSTGYLTHFRWDSRFRYRIAPCGFDLDDTTHYPLQTDTLDFAGVPLGQTVWDTAYVSHEGSVTLGSVITQEPFWATRVPPFYASHFAIPVRFTPPHSGEFSRILQIIVTDHVYEIVLHGRGLPGGVPPLQMNISPNPFNLSTTIRYVIEQPGEMRITLYDVLGRIATQMNFGSVNAGEHSTRLDVSSLASGVYFVRLQTPGHALTQKILLLK